MALLSAVSCAAGSAATASGVDGGVKPSTFHWSIGAVGSAFAEPLAEGVAEPPGVAEPVGVAELPGVAEPVGAADEAGGVVAAACGTTRPRAEGELEAGLAVALAVADGLAVPVADGEAVPVAEPLADGEDDEVAGGVAATCSISCGRRFSSAVPPTSLMSLAPAPGTDTTIRSLPWVTTSAEETPRPLTRLVMIWRAWSMDDLEGALPPEVSALRITWAPPSRSRPSLGVRDWPGQKTTPYRTTNKPRSTAK